MEQITFDNNYACVAQFGRAADLYSAGWGFDASRKLHFDRLGTYQTSSPLRDYEILDYYFADHRVSEENYIHSLFDDKNNEWCKTSKQHVLTIFKQRKQHYEVPITERKLNEQVFHKQFHNVDSDHGQAGLPNLENYYEND